MSVCFTHGEETCRVSFNLRTYESFKKAWTLSQQPTNTVSSADIWTAFHLFSPSPFFRLLAFYFRKRHDTVTVTLKCRLSVGNWQFCQSHEMMNCCGSFHFGKNLGRITFDQEFVFFYIQTKLFTVQRYFWRMRNHFRVLTILSSVPSFTSL